MLEALSNVIPDKVIAHGSAGLWNTMLDGKRNKEGDTFAYIFFSAGGMGARPDKDGLSATAYPSGIMGVPAEAIETAAPVLVHKRELIPDSGGAGKFRGGLGQELVLEVITGLPANHSCMYDRTQFPAQGFHGGQAGETGEITLPDGTHPHPKSHYTLEAGQAVTLKMPGGGGYYAPFERDPEQVLNDVRQGYVSLNAARDEYGVAIDAESMTVNADETAKLRGNPS